MIPVWSKSFKENKLLLGSANVFSAGIFISLALMHILPEENNLYMESSTSSFPLPFLVMILGYSFILLIDKVMFDSSDILVKDDGNLRNSEISAGS